MAKKQTPKPAAKAANAADATPLSPEVLMLPPSDEPPEVLGASPPVAPISQDAQLFGGEPLETVQAADEEHPAITLAQSFVTPHGVPDSDLGSFYTPPPPELRKPTAKE